MEGSLYTASRNSTFNDNGTSIIIDAMKSVRQPPPNKTSPLFSTLIDDLSNPLLSLKKENKLTPKATDEILEKFIREYRLIVGDDILPVMRLIMSKFDLDRKYLLKQANLGSYICKIFNIGKENETYTKLTQKKNINDRNAPFADVLVHEISLRRINVPSGQLTVDEINEFLDRLSSNSNSSDVKEVSNNNPSKVELIGSILPKLSNNELRFLFCVILKANPLPIGTFKFMNFWNPNAKTLFEYTNNLQLVCWRLLKKTDTLSNKDKQIAVNYPFTPMRSKKIDKSYEDVANEHFANDFYIEEKYDGERIQLHMTRNGDELNFKFFTRKGYDNSIFYGTSTEHNSSGAISPFVKDCFHSKIDSCVVDGEMICYDPVRKEALPFTTVKTSAMGMLYKQGEDRMTTSEVDMEFDPHPMFIAFDLLRYNDNSLQQRPLSERKALLSKVINKNCSHLQVAEYKKASTSAEIQKALQDAMERDSEGLILKDPNSVYKVGEMTAFTWVKIKPEYLLEFGENLDAVIVGMITGTKSKYICALRNSKKKRTLSEHNNNSELDDTEDDAKGEEEDENDKQIDPNCEFVTLCKVANGFSAGDYKKIHEITRGKWKDWTETSQPPEGSVQFGKVIPQKWIHPRDSVVIEVKASTVDLQSQKHKYATGTTLHCAYCYAVRLDKDYTMVNTLRDYRFSSNKNRHDGSHTVQSKKGLKKQRLTKKGKEINLLNAGFESINKLEDKVKDNSSDLFKDYSFCIKSDCKYKDNWVRISDLINILKSKGASTFRNYQSVISDEKKLMIIADKLTMEVDKISQEYNVFRFKWCEDCINMGHIVNFEPDHVLKGEQKLLEQCALNVDKMGDSLTIDLTPTSFSKLISNNENVTNDKQEIKSETSEKKILDSEEMNQILKAYLFQNVKFLIIKCRQTSFIQIDILKDKITFEGGTVTNDSEDCSIVIFVPSYKSKKVTNDGDDNENDVVCIIADDDDDYEQVKLIKHKVALMAAKGRCIPRLVNPFYVDACMREGILVEATRFPVLKTVGIDDE